MDKYQARLMCLGHAVDLATSSGNARDYPVLKKAEEFAKFVGTPPDAAPATPAATDKAAS